MLLKILVMFLFKFHLQYTFAIFDAHQMFIAVTLPIIYSAFAFIVFCKYSDFNLTKTQKMVIKIFIR